jgi:hypothetical protein
MVHGNPLPGFSSLYKIRYKLKYVLYLVRLFCIVMKNVERSAVSSPDGLLYFYFCALLGLGLRPFLGG